MKQTVYLVLLLNFKFTYLKMILNDFDITLDYDTNMYTEKKNLRQRFLNKKKQNHDQDMKIKLFDQMNSNKTFFVGDILHSLESNLGNEMEDAFRNLLLMNGSKFIYKRDYFWRTWRVVENESGNKTIICYKCDGFINETCSKCRSGGYWVIDENPQKCPYEIFTLKTDRVLCVVNNTQYYKTYDVCPSVITMRDLRIACGESFETIWRIVKTYDVPERGTNAICQGRESCEIRTLYSILNNTIVFRMINSTNNVYYSRAMRNDKNYVCRNDCGTYDKDTKKITKRDGPLVYDLLKNIKNKRDSVHPKKETANTSDKKKLTAVNWINNGLHYEEQKKMNGNLRDNSLYALFKVNNVFTKSPCKRLQEKYSKYYENIRDYDSK